MRGLCLLASVVGTLGAREVSQLYANPIRKVVTMLQSMQTKVTEEGKKEEELYEKFMCYCKNSGGDLEASIKAGEEKVGQLTSSIKEAEEQKVQSEADLKAAQDSRAAAEKTLSEATSLREKEEAAFATLKSDSETNIAAVAKAVAAIEAGTQGSFLQTGTAKKLQKLVLYMNSPSLEDNRETIMAFLQGKEVDGYAPQSGQITGILKTMGDEMKSGLADATASENDAIKSYEALSAAKKKEIDVLGAKIEALLGRIGELGMSLTEMKNDMTDTEEALVADKEFLSTLEEGCSTKTAEWEERQKTRAEELVALSDTIKVLNDDDALELFKKTLPSPAASFIQSTKSASALRAQALATLRKVLENKSSPSRAHLDLISLALSGKKIGFDKVITMIDEMVETLKKEQTDDDKKKEYCAKEFDTTEDKKKMLERAVSDAQTAIDEAKDTIATLKEETAALTAGIKELDKSVSDATDQRKKENTEYTELMASDSAAKELLAFAKNRLYKFYNPKMYKPPPERELSREDQIVEGMGGTVPTPAPSGIAGTGIAVLAEVSRHLSKNNVAPPPPPETFGAYSKKSGESNGVIAMIDLLIKDLDKEMQEADVDEKNAQEEYEKLMGDSAEKRASDSKSLTQKKKATADMEGELETQKETKMSNGMELMNLMKYIGSLHGECDWLMQYYSVRKEAREGEIDALGKAKAVLSGADYSF